MKRQNNHKINIIIYGAGTVANFLTAHMKPGINICAYAVDYGFGDVINGIPVIDITRIIQYNYDYIVIAFSNITKGIEKLSTLKIPRNKMVAYVPATDYKYLDKLQNKINSIMNDDFNGKVISGLFDLEKFTYNLVAMSAYKNCREIIEHDYVREQTLFLITEQINGKQVEGAVAELGVYKGEFSKKINYLFPMREMYLFDTFDGFIEDDIKKDSSILSESVEKEKWKDTSVEYVMNKMTYPQNCKIKKGFFPESFDLDDTIKFAFVSIDVDLYPAILAGLEIFYPRLSKGGYVMVHDYNQEGYSGTKSAVNEFCNKYNITGVPLSDACGSIVLVK